MNKQIVLDYALQAGGHWFESSIAHNKINPIGIPVGFFIIQIHANLFAFGFG